MAPSRAALGRLPTYLSHIRKLQAAGETSTSATAIAKALGMGEVQVRKDLSAVSGTGKPKTGYLVSDLADALEKHLGCHHKTLAVLVGAGELGRALLNYGGFADYGAEIAAAFDIGPARTTPAANGKPVYPMERLEEFLRETPVSIGIITVPAGAAQEVCDRLVASGVRAIWSFAPAQLQAPPNVIVQQENLALSLACLNARREDYGQEK